MIIEFNPKTPVARLCLQGMEMEGNGQPEEAARLYAQAWSDATNDLERFIAAHFVGRHQENIPETLRWLETALRFALEVNDDSTLCALPELYANIAACYEDLGDGDSARRNNEMAVSCDIMPVGTGPFYHGTRADLHVGEFLTAGSDSNYKPGLIMNHIYFTANVNGAGLAAALAKGDGPERVYIVEPTGSFEHDPNVTNKRFPGNPTRSYRSEAPLRIVGEASDWLRQTPGDLQQFRGTVAANKGDIIN